MYKIVLEMELLDHGPTDKIHWIPVNIDIFTTYFLELLSPLGLAVSLYSTYDFNPGIKLVLISTMS